MKLIQQTFATNLKELRINQGLTQAQLADKAGTVGNYIALLENGSKFPSADMIERIASALGVQSTDLFSPIPLRYTTPWMWGNK